MKILEIFEESVLVLTNNKMRTGLSALGIIIGIASVIALMTLGQASQESIKSRIQSLGSNLLIIRPGSSDQSGFLRGSGTNNTSLKSIDAEAIKTSNRLNTVESVASEYSSRAQVSYGRSNDNIEISGISGDYFKLRNIEIQLGSPISDENNKNVERVAVLGSTSATTLFGEGINPIGEEIRIKGQTFRVIGVTKSKGGSGPTSSDEIIYVPLTTAQKSLFGVSHVSAIYVGAKSEDQMDAAQNQVGFLLLELHKKVKVEDADFSISSQQDIIDTISSVTETFTTLLTGIAAISLIVGGIGIMNIMLVTVTERTTEIGLRKAIGAKRKEIIKQFLTESVILTATGGLIGVILGVSVSMIITKFMSLPTIISYNSIFISVAVSCVIGIIFGWYPAYKASKLQPIEALRYE